jgi:hypothetical protein
MIFPASSKKLASLDFDTSQTDPEGSLCEHQRCWLGEDAAYVRESEEDKG